MPRVLHRAFGGMRPGVDAELLNDGDAALAVNLRLTDGSLVPMNGLSTVMALSSAGTVKSIYRFGQSITSDTQYWFESTVDADFVKGPIADDTEERTYFTGVGGYPRKTNASLATVSAPYPTNSYKMGVPKPTATPSGTVSGSPSAGATTNTVVYCTTYVSAWSEEGAPSPPSAVVTYQTGQTVTVTLPSAPAGNYNITKVRLYRSNTGTDATQFQLVTEVAVGTANYADTTASSALGEVLSSTYYDEPSDSMVGLIAVPGGGMAGFFGNQLCFAEPGFPHAWPIRYRRSMNAPIVALAAFDQTVLVFTTKSTEVLTGTEPGSMVQSNVSIPYVCLSKRSVLKLQTGIVYAAAEGLIQVGASGVTNLTDGIITSKEWMAYSPGSFSAYSIDGRYIAFFDTGTRQAGLVIRLGSNASFQETDLYATAGYYEAKANTLYLVVSNTSLRKWDAGPALTYTWRSKAQRYGTGYTMSAARVEAASYPVTFKLYADGVLKHTQSVANANAFRLPGGYTAKRFYYEVTGTPQIHAVSYATSIDDLQSDG